jgi:hypothetical protein
MGIMNGDIRNKLQNNIKQTSSKAYVGLINLFSEGWNHQPGNKLQRTNIWNDDVSRTEQWPIPGAPGRLIDFYRFLKLLSWLPSGYVKIIK